MDVVVLSVVLQAGKIGIALNIEYLEPWTDSAVDKAAATTGLEAALGWFADPLFFGEQHAVLARTRQHGQDDGTVRATALGTCHGEAARIHMCCMGVVGLVKPHRPRCALSQSEREHSSEGAQLVNVVLCCVVLRWSGDYPESLKSCAGGNLPKFTPEQSQLVKGSTDFLGINFYTGK